MNRRIAVAVLAALAVLIVTPSCGSEAEYRELEARKFIREQITGSWSLTIASSSGPVTLRLEPEQDDAVVPLSGCTASRLSLIALAHACMPMYDLPVRGSSSSDDARFAGSLTGNATAYSTSGPIEIRVAFDASGLRLTGTIENGIFTGELHGSNSYYPPVGEASGARAAQR